MANARRPALDTTKLRRPSAHPSADCAARYRPKRGASRRAGHSDLTSRRKGEQAVLPGVLANGR